MSSESFFKSRLEARFFRFLIFIFSTHCFLLASHSFPEIIDRIVAVVNDQVITLTDLRIVEAFRLYDDEISEDVENRRFLILEKLINQKVILHLARKDVSVKNEEIDLALESVKDRIGLREFQNRLEEFGLNQDDISFYLQKKILFQKIISQKFSSGITVSLEEIKTYYEQVYLPSQKEKGIDPQPMIEIIDEIESLIRKKKAKEQVHDWISNLKKKAEIQIMLNRS